MSQVAGLTHKVAVKERAHVGIVPAGLFAASSEAGGGCCVALEQVQGDLAQHRPAGGRRLGPGSHGADLQPKRCSQLQRVRNRG